MFSERQAAETFLQTFSKDYDVDLKTHMNVLLEAMCPAIGFVAIDTETPGTYFGGYPELPRGTLWPVRPAVDDLERLAGLGGQTHAPHLKRYGQADFPFEFMAQIDCESFAEVDGTAHKLPATGRLLFFYDLALGPWRDGAESCRVIWEAASPTACEALPMPEAFSDMIETERAELLDGENTYNLTHEQLLECVPKFIHPKRGVRPEAVLKFPGTSTVDYRSNAGLKAALQSNEYLEDLYMELEYETGDTHLGHQMLGAPSPQQDDPRYSAAHLASDLPSYQEAGEAWPALFAKLEALAPDWVLLLQVYLSDLTQDNLTEGTVYFLIHKDDLAAHRFDKVTAVYQQT